MQKEIPTTINENVPFTKIRFIFNYLFYTLFVARNLHNQFCPLCSPNAMCTKFFRFEQEKNIHNKYNIFDVIYNHSTMFAGVLQV